jgi:segregation and condensation protein A
MKTDQILSPSDHYLFKVALDKYYGPLDLLLYLLRQNELEIHEISIASIAEQFKEFITNLKELNLLKLEVASEFLVMASRLMEMKSRILLLEPSDEEKDTHSRELGESRNDMIHQLLEYKQIKEAAERLEAQAEAYNTRYPRVDDRTTPESPWQVVKIRPVELWDLIAAFARILREIQPVETLSIQMDDVPQQVYENEIIQLLEKSTPIKLRDIFQPPYIRFRLIGIFLALLELIRRCVVEVGNDHEGNIFLSLRTPEKKPEP